MAQLIKIRLKTGEEYTIHYYPKYPLLGEVQDAVEMDGHTVETEADYEVLPESSLTKADWLEFVSGELEGANYHREIYIVENATKFMTDEKAIEYLKQVGSVMP